MVKPLEAADPTLVVRRVMPVDLRASSELMVQQQRLHGREPDVDEVRNALQTALEDAQRVLVLGAYHEGQPGFAHGKMVGALLMNVVLSVEHAGEVGWIETLFVRPDYRRLALADRMLRMAIDWSDARGLRGIDLEVGEEHEAAAATHLYRKHGFELIRRDRLTRTVRRG